jgi:hypothetical protein
LHVRHVPLYDSPHNSDNAASHRLKLQIRACGLFALAPLIGLLREWRRKKG